MTPTHKKIIIAIGAVLLVAAAVFPVWRAGILNPYLPFFLTNDGWNVAERELNARQKSGLPQSPPVVSAVFTDGSIAVTATFDTNNDTVTFTHPDTGTVTLPRVISGSGARYATPDERIVFWEHQDEVTITIDEKQIFQGGREDVRAGALSETEARAIAEASCIKGGGALSLGLYNPNSKTWWFDANLNATREGCNPACVVSEETKTAEINWRCTGLTPPDQTDTDSPSNSSECGVANCHGLDIECGKPAEMCTMMYQLGDKCRQYATCGKVNGTCRQIESPEFTTCKACVQKCERDFPNDPEKAFTCESKCGE